MAHQNLRKQAFWLYGVIVGLSIKEAVTTVIPHVFTRPDDNPGIYYPEIYRFIIFLTLIIRFYLGATKYFEEVYEQDNADNDYPAKSFGVDFLIGLLHFLIFSAMALSIDTHDKSPEIYLLLLSIILLYDLAWLLSSIGKSTIKVIKTWAFINLITFIIALLIYVIAEARGVSHFKAEAYAFIPILLFSAVDMAELVTEKDIFGKVLTWIGTRN